MFLNIPYFKRKNENDPKMTSDSELVVDKFKGHLFERLQQDYRVKEGLKACMNCGVCTAVCPAAEH